MQHVLSSVASTRSWVTDLTLQPTLPRARALGRQCTCRSNRGAKHQPQQPPLTRSVLTAGELSPTLAWFLVVGLAAVGFTITSAPCLWVICNSGFRGRRRTYTLQGACLRREGLPVGLALVSPWPVGSCIMATCRWPPLTGAVLRRPQLRAHHHHAVQLWPHARHHLQVRRRVQAEQMCTDNLYRLPQNKTAECGPQRRLQPRLRSSRPVVLGRQPSVELPCGCVCAG